MEAQRALLDQLLGADRNLPPEVSKKMKHRWKSRGICQYFVCGFCPYELFVNTKASLGICELSHEFSMQKAFIDEPMEIKKPNLIRFYRFLQSIMDELDERIAESKKRCLLGKGDKTVVSDSNERDKKLQMITMTIDELLKNVEELADSGRVEESKLLVKEIDELNEEKRNLLSDETTLRIEAESRDKLLSVCDVCGSFLIGDELTGTNRENHAEGRQHKGYMLIRAKLEELEKINFSQIKSRSISAESRSPSRRSRRHKSSRRSKRSRSKKNSRSWHSHRRHKKSRHRSKERESHREKRR